MSWTQVNTDRYENGSGWILELDGIFGWILYNENIEDEITDSFIVLADLFTNPGQSVITLDPATGKIPTGYMPALAINDTFTVNNQAAMLALTAERGDIAIRTDIPGPGMFILTGDDPTFFGNWIPLTTQFPDWNSVQNKPTAFPPLGHDHDNRYNTKSEIVSALLLKRDVGPIPATEVTPDSTHRFVTDAKIAQWDSPPASDWSTLANKPATFPPSAHDHDTRYYTQAQVDALIAAIPTGSSSGGFDVGDIKTSTRNTPATGWLLLNGQTLGNTGSGANNLGTNFQNLFILLWNDWSNTALPIQNSSGAPTTRGVSAIADWNALKRLPIPNLSGRSPIGSGTGSGLTPRALGDSLGEENHLLTIPEIPAHNHGGGTHNHQVNRLNFAQSGGGISTLVGSTSSQKGVTDMSAAIIQTQGGGSAHNNMQPSLVLNYFIKL
ncbi:phage tail protein [Leptospira kmetyi]|uniref:phage tail protein n=1 Tax=Leptospira kmetyi TaxID=408139 RepID=UPI003EBC082C